MLTLPPWRIEFETARAVEIETAERARHRARLRWYFLGLAVVASASIPLAWSVHTTDPDLGQVWFWLAILLGNVGPLVVLWWAARSEEP